MYEQENQKETHLLILLVYTLLSMALIGESILLGWELEALVLVLLGLAVSWGMHITEKISPQSRIWLYFGFSMMTFFFYGIHETSMYDLAPTMAGVIILYSAVESYRIVNLCVATYFLTMCYDFMFVVNDSMELTSLTVSRTILHFGLVCLTSWLVKKTLNRRSRERQDTDDKIKELEEINRRTENFLTNVSHELRTPINAVTGIAALMLKNEEDASKKKDILSIQRADRRLVEQIEDILDYTEIDTGKIAVSEEVYMVSSLVSNIIAEQQMHQRDSELEMIFDVDAGIPSALLGDEKKIKKILTHLIDNAVKYTERGGVYVRICALKKPYGVNLCISVSDTGSGIAEEDFEKIKERFYQANDGRNHRAGGLGLGLSIVYGMVSALEGFMRIESVHGEGTTMSVSIPQKIADETPGMEVENRRELCVAYFMMPEKFEIPKVRKFYDSMISNMVRELGVTLHRIYSKDELERLVNTYELTHLFTGEQEYLENEAFLEKVGQHAKVVVVAENLFALPRGSHARILKKPFSVLGVVNILNAQVLENVEEFKVSRILCPGVRVLVVDDEPMNLMVAKGIFTDYQMEVMTAENGYKAIELCEKETFDLVFLDHMMPEMDGVETLKRIRKIPNGAGSALTVIAFTANAVSGARKMFLQEGFDEFVAKPIEMLELERILRKVLPKSSIVFVDEQAAPESEIPAADMQAAAVRESGAQSNGTADDWMSRLEAYGIHTRSGMQYCRNDEAFYEELLLNFAKTAQQKEEGMRNYYGQEDWKNYGTLVHAVKSTAKMVGADELSGMAEKAEAAAKKPDVDYIRSHYEELLCLYHETIQYILQVLDTDVQERAPEQCRQITEQELIPWLEQLAESLDTFEADKAEELLAEMGDAVYQGTAVSELVADIRQDIDEFELGAASEKVKLLLKRVEGNEA